MIETRPPSRGRRRVSLTLLALLAIPASFLIQRWSLESGTDNFDLAAPRSEAHSGEVRRSVAAPQSAPAVSATESEHLESSYRLIVVDPLTEKPLKGAFVRAVDSKNADEILASVQTDESGACRLEVDFERISRIDISWCWTDGTERAGRSVERKEFMELLRRADGDGIKITVAGYAKIAVSLVMSEFIDDDITLRAVGFPSMPTELDGKSSEALASLRLEPETYIVSMRHKHLLSKIDDIAVETRSKSALDSIDLLIPYTGCVWVSCWRSKLSPAGSSATIVQGTVTNVSVNCFAKPLVQGHLRDAAGHGVAGVEVTVAVRSHFGAGETIPRSETEEGNPGYAMVRSIGSVGFTSVATKSVQTDQDGRFQVGMPYTDEVAVWAFMSETAGRKAKSYVTQRAGGRFSSVLGLEMTLIDVSHVDAKVRFISSSTGEPVASESLSVCESNPNQPFQLQIPFFSTNGDGYASIRFLEDGKRYRAFGKTFGSVEFVCNPGAVVYVPTSRK